MRIGIVVVSGDGGFTGPGQAWHGKPGTRI